MDSTPPGRLARLQGVRRAPAWRGGGLHSSWAAVKELNMGCRNVEALFFDTYPCYVVAAKEVPLSCQNSETMNIWYGSISPCGSR